MDEHISNACMALIAGAGPAGLAAAWALSKQGNIQVVVVDPLPEAGGMSRTVKIDGNGYELGPHRLFTKNEEILDLWENLLHTQGAPAKDDILTGRVAMTKPGGPDPEKTDEVMLKRYRFSRIYYLKKFFDYPIKLNLRTILNLGCGNTFKAGVSYVKSIFRKRPETSLEDFMINRFGLVLYGMFFEHYTQKVWGKHPSEISKDWGTQRIKGLSITKLIWTAISKIFHIRAKTETSLTDYYYYPKYGCGQLWRKMQTEAQSRGAIFSFNARVTKLFNQNGRITNVEVVHADGRKELFSPDYFISSIPLQELVAQLDSAPENVRQAAQQLEYRDYIHVAYVLDQFNLKNDTPIPTVNNICPDSWIYIQDKEMTMGRIQVMNSWSPYLITNWQKEVVIGLEYFASVGDELWRKTDDELITFGKEELAKLHVCEPQHVHAAKVVRIEKAYPAYFKGYSHLDTVRAFADTLTNLYCVGRNGQHRYNNMDHSLLSGLECARVITQGLDKAVLWRVNTDESYQEVK